MFSMIQRISRALFILGCLALSGCTSEPAPWQTSNMRGYVPELAFSLTDADRNITVTGDDFKDQVVALNFGFTHCPDVCPMSLHQMQSAISKLDTQAAKQVQVLFVTVDPKRDDIVAMKKYTDNFDKVIGLTGDKATLMQLAKHYKVGVQYGEADEKGHYDVSHSSVTYVFDRQGIARLLVRPDDSIDSIASDLARLLAEK